MKNCQGNHFENLKNVIRKIAHKTCIVPISLHNNKLNFGVWQYFQYLHINISGSWLFKYFITNKIVLQKYAKKNIR